MFPSKTGPERTGHSLPMFLRLSNEVARLIMLLFNETSELLELVRPPKEDTELLDDTRCMLHDISLEEPRLGKKLSLLTRINE